MSSGHRFHVPTLHAFIRAVFHQTGSNDQEARLVTDHLIASNLAGHGSHGIGVVPDYIRSSSRGHLQINRHAKVVKDTEAVIALGGGCAFGQVAAHEAVTLGIGKTRRYEIVTVILHNSHHIGHIGHQAEQCTAAGFASVHFVNVMGILMVAPFHGRDSRFDTNLFCVVFPRKNIFPLLLDHAASAIAFGRTRMAWHKGEPVAPGCLIDMAGVPITGPTVIQVSPLESLLTFAEHRGYVLAAMCGIMGGALSGGKTTHEESLQTSADVTINYMTTIIMNPQLFDAPDCDNRVAAFTEWVETSPHTEDAPILLPGEWEANTREGRLEHDIPPGTGSWQAICEAALQIGMPDTVLREFCQRLER